MKTFTLLAGLAMLSGVMPSECALADAEDDTWAMETKSWQNTVASFNTTFDSQAKAVFPQVDLSNKPVNANEVDSRPSSPGIIATLCMNAMRDVRGVAGLDENYRRAFKGTQQMVCQYAHYSKGDRDKPIELGDRVAPGGNYTAKNEPEADCKVVFEPARGPVVRTIKFIVNRSFIDTTRRNLVSKALKELAKSFPKAAP